MERAQVADHGLDEVKLRRPPAARLLPRHWYYGWVVVAACGALLFVSVGVGYYGLAVYLGPLQEVHGWSNGDVSLATGLYFAVSGIATALVGPQIDRHGGRRWMIPGLLCIGIGSIAIGHVTALWQLYLAYMALAVGSGLAAGVAVNAALARWFVFRRARAMAIASTGVSLGGAVLSPLNGLLIDSGGLELATPVMGAVILIVGLPIVAWVLVWDPREMGLPQDGFDSPAPQQHSASLSADVQTRRWTIREALRTVPFWAVLITFVVVLLAQTGFILHQTAFLEERLGSLSAATVTLSVTAIGSIVARLIVGWFFADRIDKRWLTMGLLIVQGAAALVVIHIDSAAATWLGILVFGFTIGNVYMMQSLLVSEVFGYVSFGAIYGLVALATNLSSGVGPWMIGLLEDAVGGYELPLTVTAVLTFAAALPVWFARAERRRRMPSPMIGRSAPQRDRTRA